MRLTQKAVDASYQKYILLEAEVAMAEERLSRARTASRQQRDLWIFHRVRRDESLKRRSGKQG